ncbi:hypothetical protein ACLOJK_009001 [Asimina triloba]
MRSPAHSQHSSSSHNSNARPSSPIYPSQLESFMDGNIAAAETIISKWDPNSSSYARVTSLFYESRQEAREFLRSVKDLQRSMELYVGVVLFDWPRHHQHPSRRRRPTWEEGVLMRHLRYIGLGSPLPK